MMDSVSPTPVAPLEEIELAVHEVQASCNSSMMKRLVCIFDIAALYTVLRAVGRWHEEEVAEVVID
jgi:hypothetical protein